MRCRLIGLVVVALLALILPSSALAAAGGPSGYGRSSVGSSARVAHAGPAAARILFVRSASLWSCRPDGSGQRRLAKAGKGAVAAAWSPDGRRIAYSGEQGVFVIGADGRGKRLVVKGGHAEAWR